MGPNTELFVDHLDFREADQRREIELTQKIGEAKGTQFSVSIKPDQAARFNVLDGTVAVTGQEETVLVEAGQVTILVIGLPPSEPA